MVRSRPVWSWRWLTADCIANAFVPASAAERQGMLADPPASTGDPRWDLFVEALAEHLAARAALAPPDWVCGGHDR